MVVVVFAKNKLDRRVFGSTCHQVFLTLVGKQYAGKFFKHDYSFKFLQKSEDEEGEGAKFLFAE